LGYKQVDAYENGLKAVEGLRQKAKEEKPYHVVLMDVQMPVLDGYEATKLLRKDETEVVRKVLVIAMTASAIQGDREKCIAAGMNDYLAKPVKADLLKRKLDLYTVGQTKALSPRAQDSSESPTPQATATDTTQQNATFCQSPTQSPGTIRALEAVNGSPPLVLPDDDTTLSVDQKLQLSPHLSAAHPTTSRNSSDTPSEAESVNTVTFSSQHQHPKRQPKKLTKSRNSSEAGLPKLVVENPPGSGEKHGVNEGSKPTVLTKKRPRTNTLTDGTVSPRLSDSSPKNNNLS
jgi:CheY-like chemotaxis protein